MKTEGPKTEVGFKTQRMLVTFGHHGVCIPVNGSVTLIHAAICEAAEASGARDAGLPNILRVVALTDGRKLTKSYELRLGYGTAAAVVPLDDEDLR